MIEASGVTVARHSGMWISLGRSMNSAVAAATMIMTKPVFAMSGLNHDSP
jgi:hypothetical protein